MTTDFKRVPAVDKCFGILDLLAGSRKAMGISELAGALSLNKSTVFHMVHTLRDLGVLENSDGKFRLGAKLYLLGKATEKRFDLLRIARPYMDAICQATQLSVFLGVRSELSAVILDKIDAPQGLTISSEIGMRLPILAGASGKILLAQLPESELDEILANNPLKPFTPYSCTDPGLFKAMIRKTGNDGLAIDKDEYIDGIRALAIPLLVPGRRQPAAIWAVGLDSQLPDDALANFSQLMKKTGEEVKSQYV